MSDDSETTAADTAIEQALTTAQSISIDGMSKSSRSVTELIAADKHLKRKQSSGFGFRVAVMRAPGHY